MAAQQLNNLVDRSLFNSGLDIEFEGLETAVDEVARQLSRAYEVVCAAANCDDISPGPGSDLEWLETLMARQDAKTVDTALARRQQFEATDPAESWSLDYCEDGSFQAAARECNDDRGDRPRRFHGFDSTGMAARDVVSRWLAAGGVPQIEVTKERAGPSQVVHYGPETHEGNPRENLDGLMIWLNL